MLKINSKKAEPPKVDDIVALRLTTGEEVIGKVADLPANGSSVSLSKPVLLQPQHDVNGRVVALGLSPVMFTADDDLCVRILREHILFGPITPSARYLDQYVRATSSIEVPKSGLIV